MQNKVFRVFISSTFKDLKPIRDAFADKMYHNIEKLCEENNAVFHPIDLRWGIGEAAAKKHVTMKICLDEIKRCKELSPKPNFIIIMGESYGWTPPPAEIPAVEMNQLLDHMSSEEKAYVEKWYIRDDNDESPVYCLKECSDEEKETWDMESSNLRKLLLDTAHLCDFNQRALVKYRASATEQEIYEGLFDVAQDETIDHIFAVFVENDSMEMQEEQKRLREAVKGLLPQEQYICVPDMAEESINEICQRTEEFLSEIIETQLKQGKIMAAYEEEYELQKQFVLSRQNGYVARSAEEKLVKGIVQNKRKKICLVGESGCGKSSLMTKMVRCFEESFDVFYCFAGISTMSYSVLNIVSYLIKNISKAYDIEITDGESITYENAKIRLSEVVISASKEKNILILIDNLDGLTDLENLKGTFFDIELPSNCCLLVSAVSTENLLFDQENEVETIHVGEMSIEESICLFDKILENNKRRITTAQRKIILNKLEQNRSPLYITILANEASTWRSSEVICTDGVYIETKKELKRWFNSLSNGEKFGEALFWHSVCYIAFSGYGVTDKEMIFLLSEDEAVLNEISREDWDFEGTIPYVVWARLYVELKPFICTYKKDGQYLMTFGHRIFNEMIEEEAEQYKKDIEEKLVSYFEKTSNYLGEEEKVRLRMHPNNRKAYELTYLLKRTGKTDKLTKLLKNDEYIDISIHAGRMDEILRDLETYGTDEEYTRISGFIIKYYNHFTQYPTDYFPYKWNFAAEKAVDDIDSMQSHGVLKVSGFVESKGTDYIEAVSANIDVMALSDNGYLAVSEGNRVRIYDTEYKLPTGQTYMVHGEIKMMKFCGEHLFILFKGFLLCLVVYENKLVLRYSCQVNENIDGFSVSSDLSVVCFNNSYMTKKADAFIMINKDGEKTEYALPDKKKLVLYADFIDKNTLAVCVQGKKDTIYKLDINTGIYQKIKTVFSFVTKSIVCREDGIVIEKDNVVCKYTSIGKKCIALCYPKVKQLIKCVGFSYTITITEKMNLELISHDTSLVYTVPTDKSIDMAMWGRDETKFAVSFSDGTIKVFDVNEIIETDPTYKMPAFDPFPITFLRIFLKEMKKIFTTDIKETENKKNKEEIRFNFFNLRGKEHLQKRIKREYLPFDGVMSKTGLAALYYADIGYVKFIDIISLQEKISFYTSKKFYIKDVFRSIQAISDDGTYYAYVGFFGLKVLDVVNKKWNKIVLSEVSEVEKICFAEKYLYIFFRNGILIRRNMENGKIKKIKMTSLLMDNSPTETKSYTIMKNSVIVISDGSTEWHHKDNKQKIGDNVMAVIPNEKRNDALVLNVEGLFWLSKKENMQKTLRNTALAHMARLYSVKFDDYKYRKKDATNITELMVEYEINKLSKLKLLEKDGLIVIVSPFLNTVHILDKEDMRMLINIEMKANILNAVFMDALVVICDSYPYVRRYALEYKKGM